jgi:hypothetical protein
MKHLKSAIRSAIEAGDFDDLKGKGKPHKLDLSGRLAGDWQLAYHLLSSSGFSLPWIEERNRILEEIERLRARVGQFGGPASSSDNPPWNNLTGQDLFAAVYLLGEQISALTPRIRDYNLSTPGIQFHICSFDAEKELARLTT